MFTRITSNPAILSGKPCIQGSRISVGFLLELIASGASRDEILSAHPQLTREDVEEALRYAAKLVRNEVILTGETPS